jgi:hypothetical protein
LIKTEKASKVSTQRNALGNFLASFRLLVLMRSRLSYGHTFSIPHATLTPALIESDGVEIANSRLVWRHLFWVVTFLRI